jgi:regulatory protein
VKVTAGGFSFLCRRRYFEVLGLAIAPGAELDEAGVESLGLATEAFEAERRALSLLARAEQSRFLLAVKLERRDIRPAAARLALDFLECEGLLDDRRFAEAWLRSRKGAAAASPARLAAGLRLRGIDEAVAKAALSVVFGPDERRAALSAAIARERRRAGLRPEELRSRLKKLGFRSEEIRSWFEDNDEGVIKH